MSFWGSGDLTLTPESLFKKNYDSGQARHAEASAKRARMTDNNLRNCPSCEFETLMGMPGGKDSTCRNCGYKDPCCYD